MSKRDVLPTYQESHYSRNIDKRPANIYKQVQPNYEQHNVQQDQEKGVLGRGNIISSNILL